MNPRCGNILRGANWFFLNQRRPEARFLFFRFIALIRIRELNKRGWEEVWAKYYGYKPFATPGKYFLQRTGRLLALAAAHSEIIAPGEIERLLLLTEGEGIPRIQIPEEDMQRVKEEVVAKIASHDTTKDGEEDGEEGEEGEFEYITMDDGYGRVAPSDDEDEA